MAQNKKQNNIGKNIVLTILILTLATALSFFFFSFVPENSANIALIYILALILISRFTTGYWYGIASAIICVICTNFLFTYPYFHLNFTLTGYPVTFVGMLTIAIITCTTTTHLQLQSEALAERERQLMEAEKEKMRANLLRAVSHDLRTPLTGIICSCNTYLENQNGLTIAEKTDLVSRTCEDANWLLNMVENLLSVTRIQNDCQTVSKSLEVVEEVASEAVIRLKKRLPEAQIHMHVPENFLMIPMDAMLIEQVIINLLENAIVHSDSTEPVNCTINETEQGVTFCVRDFGNGIDETLLPVIFDGLPYGTAHSSDSKKGMGIGLSICKTIITAHGGTIEAANHKNGAEFIFTLPKEV